MELFFLRDPLCSAGDVWGIDGVDTARSSVLSICVDGSIGSVRGLLRPQTTIDAPSVEDSSAPMSSGFNHE